MRDEWHWSLEYGIRVNGFHACIEQQECGSLDHPEGR
jgi:hypothetical protein